MAAKYAPALIASPYKTTGKECSIKFIRAKKYLMGSGAIESAHRNVVQQRLKLSGQRWSKRGAQQIVNLRAYKKSNRWTELIDLIKKSRIVQFVMHPSIISMYLLNNLYKTH